MTEREDKQFADLFKVEELEDPPSYLWDRIEASLPYVEEPKSVFERFFSSRLSLKLAVTASMFLAMLGMFSYQTYRVEKATNSYLDELLVNYSLQSQIPGSMLDSMELTFE